MTDEMMQANQVPLVERLRSVPANAHLAVNTPNPLGHDTQHFAIGAMCHKAAARLDDLRAELEAAKRDAEDCDLFLVCVEEAINELRAVLRRTPAGGEG